MRALLVALILASPAFAQDSVNARNHLTVEAKVECQDGLVNPVYRQVPGARFRRPEGMTENQFNFLLGKLKKFYSFEESDVAVIFGSRVNFEFGPPPQEKSDLDVALIPKLDTRHQRWFNIGEFLRGARQEVAQIQSHFPFEVTFQDRTKLTFDRIVSDPEYIKPNTGKQLSARYKEWFSRRKNLLDKPDDREQLKEDWREFSSKENSFFGPGSLFIFRQGEGAPYIDQLIGAGYTNIIEVD